MRSHDFGFLRIIYCTKTNESRTMKITITVAIFTNMGFTAAFAPNASSNATTYLQAANIAPGMPKRWPKVNG